MLVFIENTIKEPPEFWNRASAGNLGHPQVFHYAQSMRKATQGCNLVLSLITQAEAEEIREGIGLSILAEIQEVQETSNASNNIRGRNHPG